MAVEIPVVIDIEQAFQDAANRVSSAIKPLENKLDAYTSKMQLKVGIDENGKEKLKSVNELLNVIEKKQGAVSRKSISSLAELSTALSDAENKLMRLYAIEDAGYSLSKKQKKDKEALEKTIVATRTVIEQRQHGIRLLQEETDAQIRAKRAEEERLSIMSKVTTTMNDLSAKMGAVQGQLNSTKMFSPEWYNLLPTLGQLRNEIQSVQNQMQQFSSSVGSLDRYNAKLQEIVQSFNAMSRVDRGGSQPSMRLRQLQTEYADVKQAIDQVSRSLSAEYEARKKSAEQQERLNKRVKESVQQRRYESAVLKMTGDSIRVLNEQQRILSERLSRTKIGTAEYNSLREQLAKVNDELRKATGGVTNMTGAMRKQSVVLSNLTSMASMYFSVFGALRFAKQIRDVTGELEYQRIALGRLIQDEEYGNVLFEKIKKAAVESPFRIKDLTTFTKQLAAYRIEQENLFDTTRRLADISAGLGVDMSRLILAYGQVRAASVLRGQELRQFTEAGIPLVELLAEKFTELRGETVKTADVFKLISERAVPFSMIADIFEDLTDKGGMFFEMQLKQSQTLKGRWEKLKDTFDIALQTIGETETFERYNNLILKTLTLLSKNLTLVPKLIEGATAAWLVYYVATTKARIATRQAAIEEVKEATAKEAQRIANVRGIKNIDAYTYAMIRQKVAANALTRGLWGLWAAVVANPLGAALAAVGGIVAALFLWNKRNKDVNQSTSDLNNTIEKFAESAKEYEKVKKLSDSYERLASKTDRSAKENLKLSRTIDKLNEKFPDLTLTMNDDTEAIKNNTLAIQANNEARLADARKDAEADLKLAEQTLEQQEKIRDERKKAYELARSAAAGTEDLKATGYGAAYKRYLKEANEAKTAFEEADEQYQKTLNDVTRLREKLEPPEDTSKAWKEQLKQMQLASNGAQIFENTALDGWGRLYDASVDLEKEWKRIKEELDSMRESADKVKPEFVKEWTEDIENLEAKFQGLELIRLLFGFDWGKKTSTRKGSDTRLSDLKKQISEITNAYKKFVELRKYMSDEAAKNEIGVLFPQLKNFDPTLEKVIERIKGLMSGYKGPKDKVFLEMQNAIDTEVSNLNFDELKRTLSDKLKRVSEDIKRSETARNFFQNILDTTGDQELAATLSMQVYGEQGMDFKDRVQNELYRALNSIDKSKIENSTLQQLLADVTTLDWDDLEKNINEVPEEVQNVIRRLRSDTEKFNADWLQDFYKTFQKAKTYEERIVALQAQRDQKVAEARSRGMSESDTNAINAHYAKEIAAVELEALKDTYTWTKAFEDLDGVSTQTLENLIQLIEEYIEKNRKSLTPAQLRELTRSMESAEAKIRARNPYTAVAGAIKKLVSARKEASKYTSDSEKKSEGYVRALDDERDAVRDLQKALDDINGQFNEVSGAAKDLVSVFASDEDAAYFSEQLDNISKTMGGLGKAATGIGSLIMGNITPQTIIQTITGLAEAVAGIFGAKNARMIKKANEEIERQSDTLEILEYQYGRLEKAIEKAFGSDYVTNYNQQLANLAAQQEAYLKQAEAERSKGKKADEDKIKDYENSARDAADKILDMQSQLSEFFSGTDITSAAKDFANSWIEAYREFGSTTIAMREKFQEMVQEMVEKSLAARVMQQLLSPIFSEIDRLAQEGGELSVADIAAIAQMADQQIPAINDAMLTLMNTLTQAGYNLRSQPGQFTGIARNIANASEESITGLAAGINTQNFYLSYMPTISANVAAILMHLTGGTADTTGATPITPTNNELVLAYMATLPNIDANLAELLFAFKSVISPKSAATNTHYIAVRN